jgi:glycine cleavage system transcriptional repressor
MNEGATREYAVTVIGRDQPGIAAAIAELLAGAKANIEDSRMTILGGHFAVMMLVSLPDEVDEQGLRDGLEQVRERLGLEAAVLGAVTDYSGVTRPESTHVLTVYGADHPGIVASVCGELARHQVNIDDLATRVAEGGEVTLYTMICELTLPDALAPDDLVAALRQVGEQQGVETVLRELGEEAL